MSCDKVTDLQTATHLLFSVPCTLPPNFQHAPPTATTSTTLFACPSSGNFFTSINVQQKLHARTSQTSKSFHCPICKKSLPLRRAPPHLTCNDCNWNPTQANIHSVSQLLARDTDPFPRLSERFRALTGGAGMEEEGGAIWKKEEERMMTEWMRELDVTECIGVETVDAYDLYKRELAPRRGETKWEAMYASPFAQDVYERFIGGWCAEWVLPKIDVWISEGELARVRMRNERAVRAYVRVGEMYENGFVDDTDSEVEIRAFDKVEKIVRGRCGRKVVLFGLQVRYEDDGADWTTDGDEKVSGDKKRLLRHVWRVYVYATAVN